MRKVVQYISRLFAVYNLFLYRVDVETVLNTNIISTEKNVTFQRIGNTNYKLVSNISGELVGNVKKMLSYEDYGVFDCVNGKPVGYGWVKEQGSKDAFFIFENSAYLCRFFIHPDCRGMNLYPLTIKHLVDSFKSKYSKFHIAIERNNEASIKGAAKMGFKQIKELTFVRILRCTFNKCKITTS